ncbi:MAG: PucR family transcriptional regulator [Rhodococcus sp. (in: high G+C Gram-positive bacteria)]|nr:MAG: PucR family transcriptional regulator [Rhodococcus sp. (in: high G+C Gram-positive bacteria)]
MGTRLAPPAEPTSTGRTVRRVHAMASADPALAGYRYLAEDCAPAATATGLFVHRNTLRNRLKLIERTHRPRYRFAEQPHTLLARHDRLGTRLRRRPVVTTRRTRTTMTDNAQIASTSAPARPARYSPMA